MGGDPMRTCLIWGTAAEVDVAEEGTTWRSPRAGGSYLAKGEVQSAVAALSDDGIRARLTSRLSSRRLAGARCPEISREMIREARTSSRMNPLARSRRLLLHATRRLGEDASEAWDSSPDESDEFYLASLAVSESLSGDDLRLLLEDMIEARWMNRIGDSASGFPIVRPTLRGYEEAERAASALA